MTDSSYNPHKTMSKDIQNTSVKRLIPIRESKYNNFLPRGHFNPELTEEAIKNFCHIHNFKNLLDKRTCYESPTSPSCVALIIKSKPRSFQNSCTIDTRLLHFHEMTPKVIKSSFAKQKPRVHKHCSYEVFKNTLLRN